MYNLIFWGFAYLITGVAILFAVRGYRAVRRGDYGLHRTLMNTACNLILFFVAAYLVKVLVLGREDKTTWENLYLYTLYIHEGFIGLMLVTGIWARWLSHQFKDTLFKDKLSETMAKKRKLHGRLGKVCLGAAGCGLFTATIILIGMFGRL